MSCSVILSCLYRLDKQCAPTSAGVRSNRLKASQFVAGNKEHVQQLRDMGIQLATMADGRIQLLHTASEAINPQMAEEGFIFMQEMIDLSKNQPADSKLLGFFIEIRRHVVIVFFSHRQTGGYKVS